MKQGRIVQEWNGITKIIQAVIVVSDMPLLTPPNLRLRGLND